MQNFENSWQTYLKYYNPSKLFPNIEQPQNKSQLISSLLDIEDEFDVLLLDGFGVLNVGGAAIPEMVPVISTLIERKKPAFVLTNGASLPSFVNAVRYPKWGYNIPLNHVISSRNAAEHAVNHHDITKKNGLWGVISVADYDPSTFNANTTLLTDANIDTVDGIIFLSTLTWDKAFENRLITSLKNNPRPVLIGNPDVCAPMETGFTTEPGEIAKELYKIPNLTIEFYGKPFQLCYELSYQRICELYGNIPKNRILMVGDTLHTDILGGNTFGMKTALTADWGFLRGQKAQDFIAESTITPNFIISNATINQA